MKLPTLYSRTSTGAIQQWDIEIIGNTYITREGQVGGKITESMPTVCFGKNTGKKNATTDEEQAIKEATALHKKKKKNGNKENIEDIDNLDFEEPMLAHKLKDHRDKVVFPCMLDRKYNGGRVLTQIGGQVTRKNEPYRTIPHLFDALKDFFAKNPDAFIDGEGYNHEYRYNLNDLMSILRKRTDKSVTPELLEKSRQTVKLYVYDGYDFEVDGIRITKETGCKDRRDALKKALNGIPYIVVVDYFICNNWEELDTYYQDFLNDGYEGGMVRNMYSAYVHDRTTDLLKMKPEDDAEGIILSIQEGNGNSAGLAVTATLSWDGKEFKANINGKKDMRAKILQELDKWIGREVTFKYNGLTGLGIPNYAKINPHNCFKE